MSAIFSPWFVLGAMWIALGIQQFVFGAEYQAEADERRLSRLSFGSRYKAPWWQGARATGVLFVGMGVVMIVINIGDRQPVDPTILMWMGILLIVVGLWSVFVRQHVSEWRRRLHRRHLTARAARGHDAYFEESRALDSYPPAQSTGSRRWSGAIAVAFGVSLLALSITN